MNKQKEVIIPPSFDDAESSFGTESAVHRKYACVCQGEYCGIIDEEGTVVVPIIYQEAYPLFADLFAVRIQDEEDSNAWKVGVINVSGETVIPFDFKQISAYDGLIRCCKEASSRRLRLISLYGTVFEYSSQNNEYWFNSSIELIHIGKVVEAKKGFLVLENNDLLGLKNGKGELLLPFEYEEIHCVSSHRIVARKTLGDDWNFGLLADDATIIIPFKYKYINHSHEHFFECSRKCISEQNTWRHERNNRYIYSEMSDSVWYDENGVKVFDGNGKLLTPDILAISKNGLWGAMNRDHKRIINFVYDDICAIHDKIVVGKDGKLGLLSSSGEIIISQSYISIECVKMTNKSYGGYLCKKTYGSYNYLNAFDTACSSSNLKRKVVYYYFGGQSIGLENEDEFDWDSFFILSTDNYQELFTIREGIIASSRSQLIYQLSELFYAVKRESKWGVFRVDIRELIVPCEYDRLHFEGGHVLLLSNEGLWGATTLVHPSNPHFSDYETRIPIKYQEIKILDAKQRLFGVRRERTDSNEMIVSGYTLLLANGEQPKGMKTLPDTDSQFELYRGDRILTSRGTKWGFFGASGYESIPFKYDLVERRKDGNFDVQIDGKWGVMNIDGKEIVAVKYLTRLPDVIENAIVQDFYGYRYGLLSADGTEKIPSIHEHLFISDDLVFFGHGGYKRLNSFAEVEGAKWGCATLDGEIIISANYDCYWKKGDYILAGRNGFWVGDSRKNPDIYNGLYDLYSLSGELLIGGLSDFEESDNYFLILLNGKWESFLSFEDKQFDIQVYDYRLNEKDAFWLVLDKNLLSVNLGKAGTRVQFRQGFIVTIRREIREGRNIYIYNLDVTLLIKNKPLFTDNYMLTSGKGISKAIRLCDGHYTDNYDEISLIDDFLFFVRKEDFVGIVSFDNQVLLPLEYFALTNPVNGYIFGFRNNGISNCSVDLIHSEKGIISIIPAITSRQKETIIDEILCGLFIITTVEGIGLKVIGVYRPSIFNEEFSSKIASGSNGVFHKKYSARYWFSNDPALDAPERDDSYLDYGNDDWDYRRERWNAMTDGMYGDFPDDFDDDYSFMGR